MAASTSVLAASLMAAMEASSRIPSATNFTSYTGERVRVGQVIAEVMVDKVSLDVEAPIDGTVTLLVEEESAVRQGTPIAQID